MTFANNVYNSALGYTAIPNFFLN